MIYIPIEETKRELLGKLLFSSYLATKGFESIIFEHTFFDRYFWPFEGTYIGKNCFRTEVPQNPIFYKKMKNSKVNLFFLDEEGGVYNGSKKEYENALLRRIDLKLLDNKDKVFTWGKKQKEILKKKNKRNLKIIDTGNPEFEFLKKKYHKNLRKFDLKITKKKEKFILITTRFTDIAHKKDIEFYLGENSGGSKDKNLILKDLREHSFLMPLFIEAVLELSKKFRNLKFVLRPHPEEDPKFFKFFFKDIKNVSIIDYGPVEPWIRLCKGVITHGCTTALQADIGDKPVIIYEPIEYSKNNFSSDVFVNKIGKKARSIKDLIRLVKKFNMKNKKKVWEEIINNESTLEKIVKELKYKKIKRYYILNIFSLFEGFKNFIKYILLKKNKFDEDNIFKYLPLIINLSGKIFKKKIIFKKISNHAYLIKT